MVHELNLHRARRAALLTGINFLMATVMIAPGSQAADSNAADQADFKGRVEKAVKQNGEEVEQKLGSTTSDKLGDGATVPAAQSESSAVAETETKTDKDVHPDKKEFDASASPVTETPKTGAVEANGKKVPVQKGKAESDGTVSHGETGVDWSKWVSTLADRWYWNLKNMEYRSAKVFRTARPALIHFTCYRNGTISNIYLRQTCGVPAYDQMQIEALKRCVPLAPFPEGSIRQSYSLLQGWECHPKVAGEQDFQPGSYGKNFPVEHVGLDPKPHQTKKAALAAKPKTAGKPSVQAKAPVKGKTTSKAQAKATVKTPAKA